MRGDRMSQFKAACQRIACEKCFSDQCSLAVRSAPSGARNMVSVSRALDEVVKAGVPDFSEVGRNAGESDAQVINVVAHKVKSAPVRILVGRALVPHFNLVVNFGLPTRLGQCEVQLGFGLLKKGGRSIDGDAVHGQLNEIEPQVLCIFFEHLQCDDRMGNQLLVGIGRYIQVQFVRADVE